MPRQAIIASMTLGVMMFVSGLCSMWFGTTLLQSIMVSGLGPFDGAWDKTSYFVLGTVLVVLGSGFFTFGFLNRRGRASL